MEIFFKGLVLLLGISGLLLSRYIFQKKRAGSKMVCPLDSDCETVVHSEYSKLLGVPLEVIGMVYYSFISISYVVFLFSPESATELWVFSAIAITTTALLFSCYLVGVQAFAIKEWCTWCLTSAFFCLLIFISMLLGLDGGLRGILLENKFLIGIIHTLSLAVSVGAISMSSFLFFTFLKDLRIADWESETMRTTVQFVWFSIAVVIMSGIGVYLPHWGIFLAQGKLPVLLIAFVVLLASLICVDFLITPTLTRISLGENHTHQKGELLFLRRGAFVASAVACVSFYFIFSVTFLGGVLISFSTLVLGYLVLLLCAIAGALIFERIFNTRS